MTTTTITATEPAAVTEAEVLGYAADWRDHAGPGRWRIEQDLKDRVAHLAAEPRWHHMCLFRAQRHCRPAR